MIPAPFEYIAPATLEEAIRILDGHKDEAKLLAGGHSLLPLMKLRLAEPKILVDIGRIPALRGIKVEGDKITIGALTTHYQIESSELLQGKCPLLAQTAGAIGDVQVRNRGTIGGSLAHGDPAADMPAAILALNGELRARGMAGDRWIKAEDFFLGLMATALEPAEILTEIRVPVLARGSGTAYLKAPQKASGFAVVGVAAWLKIDSKGVCEESHIAITGLDVKPYRAKGVEERLRGRKLTDPTMEQAALQVAEGIDPMEDMHASAEFRSHLARVYTLRAMQEAARKLRK
ncbi:MAG: FAD binding domain-containing protein [Candidatus Binatia bacterium]